MIEFDVVIIGGGIGGSTAAIHLAKQGKDVLLVEREKTPRHKVCSGIQFPYFEKLIGIKIPRDLPTSPLVQTQLTHTEIDYPAVNGKKRKNLSAAFPMLNFMRNTFDVWLNKEAANAGATFIDQTSFIGVEKKEDSLIIQLEHKGLITSVKTRFLIGADGVNSSVRKQMRPNDFLNIKNGSGGINYYIRVNDESKIKLKKTTLLQIWNVEYNDLMFAWVYIKDEQRCSDEQTNIGSCTNAWVIGTSYSSGDVETIGKRLLEYVSSSYGIKGKILRIEKIVVDLNLNNETRFSFGDGNILLIGDAAGLIDAARGLGMDAAALSARKAVSSILSVISGDKRPAAIIYAQKMEGVKSKLKEGSKLAQGAFKTNTDLLRYMDKTLSFSNGLKKIIGSNLNLLRDPEKMELV